MKGLLVVSHQMEDGEALTTRALLRRSDLDVVTITYENTKDIVTAYGLTIKADYFAHEIHLDQYDFIIVPGGSYVSKVVDHDIHIKELVKYFDRKQKLVAAICAGPRFLGQAGILNGKKYTAFGEYKHDMPKGIYQSELKAIRDGHVITARSAGAVYEFAYEIVKYLQGEDKAKLLLERIRY